MGGAWTTSYPLSRVFPSEITHFCLRNVELWKTQTSGFYYLLTYSDIIIGPACEASWHLRGFVGLC